MSGYHATVDSPGAELYQDLMKLYPTAKVVLSVRDSDEAWYKSFSTTLAVACTERFGWLVYPVQFLRCMHVLLQAVKNTWMRLPNVDKFGPRIHAEHNKDVQSNVPPEKLLTFNVKQGWKPLCEFLDVPIPEVPFPNLSVSFSFSLSHPILKEKFVLRIAKM